MSIKKNTTITLVHTGLSFTTIINQTMDRISDAATLGIYCYLSSKPEGWIIREKQLMARFNKCRDFIRNCMRQLKSIGLVKVFAEKDNKGKITGWKSELLNYIPDISEPTTQLNKEENPITENPPSGENHMTGKPVDWKTRRLEIHPHINNIYIQKKEDYKTYAHLEKNCHNECQDIDLIEKEKNAQTSFELFWELYPVKKSKARALAAWFSQNCYLEIDTILAALRQQIKNDQDFLNGYIPYPARYVMEQRWQDEIRNINKTPKKSGDLDFSSRDWAKDIDFNRF